MDARGSFDGHALTVCLFASFERDSEDICEGGCESDVSDSRVPRSPVLS